MGNAGRIHYAGIIAASVFLTSTAFAKPPKEPVAVELAGSPTDAANAIAAGCIGLGWAVSDRTEFSIACTDTNAQPNQAAVTFQLVGHGGATLVQFTTRQAVIGGFRPIFGPSRKLATEALAMLEKIGATKK